MDKIHSESPDNPFSPKVQITKLYSNKSIDQFFSVLINSIGGKDFLVLVIGEPKSGKTTLLSKLTDEIGPQITTCQLKIRKNDDPALEDNKHPIFLYSTEESQVIIMDDAHDLSHYELSIILKNAWDSKKKISQLILFCQPSINSTIVSLLKEMPKKTSVNKLYIPCFDSKQTESYLTHYLVAEKISNQFSFSISDIKDIYKKSNGLPGVINQEAEKIFSKNMSRLNAKQSKLKFHSAFTIVIILIVIIVIGSFFAQKTSLFSIVSSDTKVSYQPSNTITKNIQPAQTIDPINLSKTSNIKKQTKQDSIIKTSIQKPVQAKAIDSVPESVVTKPSLTEPPLTEPVAAEPIIKSHQQIYQENWIMTQEPLSYTIQVMAAKDIGSINRFLKLNNNTQIEIAYYRMYSKKEIWYKFICGKYKTLDKAKIASLNLPEKLKNLGPWPRQFANIQTEIENFNKMNNTN